MSFTCLIGIISDSETLELLAASLSFKDLLPYLTFTWSCFIYGTVSLLLICDYCKCSRLSNDIFFLLGESYPLFPSELPHISFNFLVELFYLILCAVKQCSSITTNLFVFFYFIHYPYIVWAATPFCLLFLSGTVSLFCVNVMHISLSWLLLHGHSILFPFGS